MYDAIISAADLIEKSPRLWNFDNCSIPDCGTPGCAIGLIGFFVGNEHSESGFQKTARMLGGDDVFYDDIALIIGTGERLAGIKTEQIPHYLRLYAEKHHAVPTYDGHEPCSWEEGVWKPKELESVC